jgi:hypothetical protein
MSYYEFRDNLPKVPKWLASHILDKLEDVRANPIQYDENFKRNMIKEAEEWIGEGDQALAELAQIDYKEDESLGYHFMDSRAFTYKEKLAQFDFLGVDEVVNTWVELNIQPLIPERILGVNIQVMHSGSLITPHSDELRTHALNYIFETGGEDVITAHYIPLPEYKTKKIYPRTLIPFEKLKKVSSVIIDTKRWHRIDVITVHSVENLDPTKLRISLSLSLMA